MRRLALCALLIAAPASAGTIQGTVTFDGTPAPQSLPDRSNDAYCAGTTGQQPILVVDGKLSEVFIGIASGPVKPVKTPPADPVVITQSKCEYTPRVVGVITGQKLEIVNADPTFHNVRIVDTEGKVMLNKPQSKGAAPLDTDAITQTGPIELHCDVHSWMVSYAIPTPYAAFAVTGADGKFTLKDLPAGTYKLYAWHPGLDTKQFTVKVKKGKKAAKVSVVMDLNDRGG